MMGRFEQAVKAKDTLLYNNGIYMNGGAMPGDFSQEAREEAYKNGQKPYAVIITCSDSRVVPEAIFCAGIGDLFVIRTAGNTIDGGTLGSIQYAAEHLGCKLVVVLGHTRCGAVDAALHSSPEGYVRLITEEILKAAGVERDMNKACVLNAQRGADKIKSSLALPEDVKVISGIYYTDSGKVELFD